MVVQKSKKPTMAQRRKTLANKCDRLSKLHARYKNAYLLNGIPHAVCVTCHKEKPIDRNLHGGHFIKSTVWPIRWHINNIHAQCVGCNKYLDGNEAMYARYIIDTYGIDEFNRLTDISRRWRAGREKAPTIIEMEHTVEMYTALISVLEVQPPNK